MNDQSNKLPRDLTADDLHAALEMMHDIEDRVIRARMEGRRARISITQEQWATLRDTLISAAQNLGNRAAGNR